MTFDLGEACQLVRSWDRAEPQSQIISLPPRQLALSRSHRTGLSTTAHRHHLFNVARRVASVLLTAKPIGTFTLTQIAGGRGESHAAVRVPSGGAAAVIRRASSLAFGFPGAHAFNALLSIVFVIVQTLIFSRVFDAKAFAQAIAAGAIGMYLPINQSVARANFVLLRGPRHQR